MRRGVQASLSLGVLAAVLGAAAWYVRAHWADFSALDISRPSYLAPLVLLALVGTLANGLQVRSLVWPSGIRLSFREWFGLAVITTFYNTITPLRGGMVAKAAYLKRRHEFPLTAFAAMTAGLYLVTVFVAGLLGLAGLCGIWLRQGRSSGVLIGLFAGVAACAAALMLFSPRFPESGGPLLGRLGRVANGWHLIRGNPAVHAMAWYVSALQYGSLILSTLFSFGVIGVSVGLDKAAFMASLNSLSMLIGITPAGLGITEAVAVFAGLAVGITPAEALTAAIARRIATTAVTLLLGPPFTYALLRSGGPAGPPAAPDDP